ncbi:hypothetical protein [Hymenobacter latericus]|uniref:hypothetical protein n=1 Tax=Hymenobacter sp. YIM 151858-1 TaxID=2987688 RepID=UPI002226B745|nr:hypothetical protein [Hymenobacter sp. YIM 151858-1]UYZ60105.1 hypothetical protein OIS50_04715 [Hymenobacter sp. YIM 151858-1]
MKDQLRKHLDEFINGSARPYFDQSLIDGMLAFGDKLDQQNKGRKAFRVYVKCLARKKPGVANRIKNKYGHAFPRPDDRTLALGFAMIAASKY